MVKCLWLGGLFICIIMQTPLLLALNCNGISQANLETCINILSLNLTNEEKSLIISNLDYNNKFHPDHRFVYQRNTQISTPVAPNEVPQFNGQYIRNAWASILTIIPSVIYDDNLFVPNRTAVLTGFNYQISIPSNYYSSGYPSTSQGDCRRIYTLVQNASENKIFVNDLYQGSGRLVSCDIQDDSLASSVYNIDIVVDIDHYSWNRYCCGYSNGQCREYCHRCRFSYDEEEQDSMAISDSQNVKYYNSILFGDIKTIQSYGSTSKLGLNYSNSIELSFQDSKYNFHQFTYDINYSKEPYYFYTLRARDYNRENSVNILKDGRNKKE